MQHLVCHGVRRDSSAIKFDIYFSFISLAETINLWLRDGNWSPRRKALTMNFWKLHIPANCLYRKLTRQRKQKGCENQLFADNASAKHRGDGVGVGWRGGGTRLAFANSTCVMTEAQKKNRHPSRICTFKLTAQAIHSTPPPPPPPPPLIFLSGTLKWSHFGVGFLVATIPNQICPQVAILEYPIDTYNSYE